MNGRFGLPVVRLVASVPDGDGRGVELDWTESAMRTRELISEDQIELWQIDLDAVADVAVARLRQALSADECARADRFRFDRDRCRFVITRGALRCLLAGSVGVSPAAIRFRYGLAGKPLIAGRAAGVGVHFNVTHSGNLALIAITRAGDIGIDLEPVRDLPDWEGVANLVFDARQVAQLHSFAEPRRMQAFFRAWTRKEAIAKARGTGLGGAELNGPFTLSTFSFFPNWVVSIAAPPQVRFLRCRGWDSDILSPSLTVRHHAPFSPAAADSAVNI